MRSSSGITGIESEDAPAAEVGPQPLEDDDVRGDHRGTSWRSRPGPRRTALKYCQAIASDMTFVLPLPVAILTQ